MAGKKASNGTLVGLTIGHEELAALFGVARESIARMVREDGLPKTGYGKYPVVECLRWYIDRLKAKNAGESTEITEERRKLIVAQRVGQELENAKMRGELLDAGLVASAIQHMGALVSTQLEGLAPRVCQQLAVLKDPIEIRRVLQDECRAIRRAASGAVSHFAGELVAGEDSGAAAPKKRRRVGGRKPHPPTGQSGAGAVAN